MSSNDNPRLPLTSAATSITKYTEMRNQTDTPSTTISIPPSPPAPTVSAPSLNWNSSDSTRLTKQGSVNVNEYELRRMPTGQRRFVKKTLMGNVGYRLGKRKQLHIER